MSIVNIYLQSFKKHDEVLRLSDFQSLNKNSFLTHGWYMYIGKTLSYLLFNDEKLFLAFGEKIIEIGKETYGKWHEAENENIFELFQENKLVLTFSYPKVSENSEDALLGFIDDEDFNWGLFLRNIVNNLARREIIWSEIKIKTNE